MSIIRLLLPSFIAISLLLGSCKKSDDAAGLTAGRCFIKFNTNVDFAGSTSFDVNNTATTLASSDVSGSTRDISLAATQIVDISGKTRAATLSITLPTSANTDSGPLTGDFASFGSQPITPNLALGSTTGPTTAGPSYGSKTGTITITKLTATEIEGSFNASVVDGSSNTIAVTGGSFAGKFN